MSSEPFIVVVSKPGIIELSDKSKLVLRVAIAGVRYLGFSPFGGANFAVKVTGGVSSFYIPDELKEQVKDKPHPPPNKLPEDGWEYVEIERQEPAVEEVEVTIGNSRYRIIVKAEAVMVVRNLNYRTDLGDPLYVVHWDSKICWKKISKE